MSSFLFCSMKVFTVLFFTYHFSFPTKQEAISVIQLVYLKTSQPFYLHHQKQSYFKVCGCIISTLLIQMQLHLHNSLAEFGRKFLKSYFGSKACPVSNKQISCAVLHFYLHKKSTLEAHTLAKAFLLTNNMISSIAFPESDNVVKPVEFLKPLVTIQEKLNENYIFKFSHTVYFSDYKRNAYS